MCTYSRAPLAHTHTIEIAARLLTRCSEATREISFNFFLTKKLLKKKDLPRVREGESEKCPMRGTGLEWERDAKEKRRKRPLRIKIYIKECFKRRKKFSCVINIHIREAKAKKVKRSHGSRCVRCSGGEYYYLYYLFFASNTCSMLIIELRCSLRDGRKGFFRVMWFFVLVRLQLCSNSFALKNLSVVTHTQEKLWWTKVGKKWGTNNGKIETINQKTWQMWVPVACDTGILVRKQWKCNYACNSLCHIPHDLDHAHGEWMVSAAAAVVGQLTDLK